MEWIGLIQTLGGIIGGIGIGAFTKAGRKRDKADADAKVQEAQKLMIDNYEERIKDLHSVIDRFNSAEVEHSERVHSLNRNIDSLTERNRELSDRCWKAEQEMNRVNGMLAEKIDENGRLSLEVERLEGIRCHRFDCNDRLPPELVERLRNLPRNEPRLLPN